MLPHVDVRMSFARTPPDTSTSIQKVKNASGLIWKHHSIPPGISPFPHFHGCLPRMRRFVNGGTTRGRRACWSLNSCGLAQVNSNLIDWFPGAWYLINRSWTCVVDVGRQVRGRRLTFVCRNKFQSLNSQSETHWTFWQLLAKVYQSTALTFIML